MNVLSNIPTHRLLSNGDPSPVGFINKDSDHPLLLICEHAGQTIPEKLDALGLNQHDLDNHIGWDIGAEAVTRIMAKALGAPAVLQRYSRLVIDCNRPPEAPDAIPVISDGVEVPGNMKLDPLARNARITEIFEPFHAAVSNLFGEHPRRIVLSIHSFTGSMNGALRPWDIGFLFRQDTETSQHLRRFISEAHPNLNIGVNQPYQIDDASDWFVPHHGEARGIPHSLIEIRNDQIRTAEGQVQWADILVNAANRYLKEV